MAQHRHKRETNARRSFKPAHVAAPAAVLLTLSSVAVGVLGAQPTPDQALLASASLASALPSEVVESAEASAEERTESVSRKASRAANAKAATADKPAKAQTLKVNPFARTSAATTRAVRKADTKLWTTEDLNLWNAPGSKAANVGLVESGEKVLVTGRREAGRAEIVRDKTAFWVTAEYLSDTKPDPAPALGGACTNGSDIARPVSASIEKVWQATCANWPQVTSYGTLRGDGEHAQGRAVDIMVSGETGWEIANFLRANASALGVEYVIYSQQIWSVERNGEGWRGMSDRGSVTANHYDHVHVTVW